MTLEGLGRARVSWMGECQSHCPDENVPVAQCEQHGDVAAAYRASHATGPQPHRSMQGGMLAMGAYRGSYTSPLCVRTQHTHHVASMKLP